jgi:hypothetical protein
LEKSGLEKTSALKLLSVLSEETKALIYRELNGLCEDNFTGKLRRKFITDQENERLKVLEALEKEQLEVREKERSEQAEEAKEPQEFRMLD